MVINSKETLIKELEKKSSLSFGVRVQRYLKNYNKNSLVKSLIREQKSIVTHAYLFNGKRFEVVLPDNISVSTFINGYYEHLYTKAFLKLLKPKDCFFDIGAHIGYYSVVASSIINKGGYIVAFEPTPSTFEILLSNLSSNKNSRAINVGVHSSSGELELNDFGIRNMSLNTFSKPRLESESLSTEKKIVKTISVDEFVAEEKIIPSIIKIDAESSELEILKGAVKTLKGNDIILMIEVGDFAEIDSNNSLNIIDFLENIGYNAYEFNHTFLHHDKQAKAYKSQNLFFSRNNLEEH